MGASAVLLAATVLKDKFSKIQMVAVLLATIGVSQEIFRFGQFPTLAVILAGSFGVYGLIRKMSNIRGSEGLLIETIMLLPFASGYLLYLNRQENLAFLHQGTLTDCLLLATGFVTTIPLIWFISATKKLNYSVAGMMH